MIEQALRRFRCGIGSTQLECLSYDGHLAQDVGLTVLDRAKTLIVRSHALMRVAQAIFARRCMDRNTAMKPARTIAGVSQEAT